ncbi:hypothetical protein DXG03_006077 [Asterophora parasitica]|uniref:DH domain-containing protein n=1 Tax=Asterophora parasitica TaxID=117018 RepID=A0A9P7GGD6_9AGAR|nr:hypothetical protein DXG03_006077 [Asterophora parasitica]
MVSSLVVQSDAGSVDPNLEYLREHASAALPPSPLSPSSYGRPRAPTSGASEDWSPTAGSPSLTATALSALYTADSPLSDAQTSPASFARPPKPAMPLPDPSHFPDPYPFRPPHHHLHGLPALSSAGSSSTRSSAYTSSGSALASGDYGHIHVATGDDDAAVGVGITSDAVVQMLVNEPNTSSSARGIQSRAPVDQSRWSGSYSAGVRSRSSSIGNTNSIHAQEMVVPKLQQKPSYDMGWQSVDERDEVGMSEEETDDDHQLDDEDEEDKEEERTSAVVIAEEGRGLIVQGDNVPIAQLHVPPAGTTHLLIGSSSTPNAMPAFLTSTLPQICHSLLALDISANFLGALPPVLAVCENLEELNIAFNPLRVLPVFLADLTNLRVIIADSTGISTLPDTLVDLEKIHTISVRKNKLQALPSWLCLLPALKTLCVDGNPFQGPWKALVEPLLAKVPMSPMYPPSTPVFPLPSASIQGSYVDTETDNTDTDDLSDCGPSSAGADDSNFLPEDEDHTITPDRAAPALGRSVTSPLPFHPTAAPQRGGLTRTRTTPNRAHFDQSRSKPRQPPGAQQEFPSLPAGDSGHGELRKMKSAGDLRRKKSGQASSAQPGPSPPARPGLAHYATSASSSNLLNTDAGSPERPGTSKRFATIGPGLMAGSPSRPAPNGMRPQLTKSLWDTPSNAGDDGTSSNRVSFVHGNTSSTPQPSTHDIQDGRYPVRARSAKDGKEKGSRWGFLKKMSMGKMRVDSPSPSMPSRVAARPHTSAGPSLTSRPLVAPAISASISTPERSTKSPQIDMRFSTTGILDGLNPQLGSPESPPHIARKPSRDMLSIAAPPPSSFASSSNLLAPPSPLPRSAKRRSFLPIDAPGARSLNIPIPDSSPFVPGLTALNGGDDPDLRVTTPSPVPDSDQYLRREEERAREAYMRALRSVMAYLKDMNDLGLSQHTNPLSMYGAATDDAVTPRSRRPTMVDGHREVSMALSGSTGSSDSNGQLRSLESMAGLRSGSSAQTLSVATTDSTGSSDERKFKDDKGKRAMIVREIVATERTYVNGLQELVDIYIKPGCLPVNILSGVGSNKDTVVPATERKVVFSGIDALFSFHKDSFLPALEVAAAPLLKPAEELARVDADGQLSLNVVKAVGSMFLKHAAFMKMYSSYINNFDSSVQRVKHWTSERNAPGATSPIPSAISPSSSTAQLVGLGLSLTSVSNPGVVADGGPAATGVPNLTTSQRKRIKSYLKRCRMNPRHSQLNLEGYLLLPVQRIPRYRLLLEELLRSTPPTYEYMDDPLERALAEISSLANNMNEGKRESESRRKLVQWQSRIRGKFPSPLVQPHRRLIMDGPLLLTRVVRKAMVSFEAINAQGDASTVQVDCLAPELTPRSLVGILCNDLLVLCRDPSDGQDPASFVDLWAVLRMQTLPQPASIVHGNALRLVDNKAILYFDAPSPSDALNWYRAINIHIPASKT